MSLSVQEAHPLLAARVRGVHIRQGITPADAAAIEQLIARYPVLIFPDQRIDDDQQMAFSRHFGPLQVAVSYATRPGEHRLAAAITDVSNIGKDAQTFQAGDRRRMNNLGSRRWHTDSSYLPVSARYSLLSAHSVPPVGGETQFADMRAAYDALPDHLRDLVETLEAEHDVIYSRSVVGFTDVEPNERAALPPTHKKLVRVHPLSGRKSLYLSSHASHIVGWPVPEGRDLLHELTELATQPGFVYTHVWSLHDLVMWDNRCTMHRGRRHLPETHPRDMHRTTVEDRALPAAQRA